MVIICAPKVIDAAFRENGLARTRMVLSHVLENPQLGRLVVALVLLTASKCYAQRFHVQPGSNTSHHIHVALPAPTVLMVGPLLNPLTVQTLHRRVLLEIPVNHMHLTMAPSFMPLDCAAETAAVPSA